ncbi:MAG: hypothetical protein ACRCZS_13295 [Chroococcidiopsis sp.]
MHPQIKIVGEGPDGTIRAIAVNPDGSLPIPGGSGGSSASLYEQVLNAPDLVRTFTYADTGTSDERINTIGASSLVVGVEFYDNHVYDGTPGNYRLIGINRNINILGT